ncbi:MAG: TolC family protein [Brumimicrobium sp.]|nr:TolC family protein [Brumimicrobium sp.]
MRYVFLSCLIVAIQFSEAQELWSLDQMINRVLSNNFDIQLSEIDQQVATNNNNPVAAGYLPRLSINADRNIAYSSARQEFLNGAVNEAEFARNRSFDAGVLLNWTFFDGFKMFATDKKLDELENSSTLRSKAQMEMSIYQTAVNFYTLASLQKLDSLYLEAISLSKYRIAFVQTKLENGAANRIELEQARLDLQADSSNLLSNRRSISEVSATLSVLLNISPLVPIRVSDSENDISKSDDWAVFRQKMMEQNTTLMLAKSEIAIAQLEEKESKSRFYPQLSFYSTYNFANQTNEVGFLRSNRSFGPSFGISASWDILDNLTRVTQLKNSRLETEKASLNAQKDSLSIESELRQMYENLTYSREKYALEKRNIEQITAIKQITEKALEFGSINPWELREIQYSVINAKTRLLQSELEFRSAQLNISLLTGDFKNLLQ